MLLSCFSHIETWHLACNMVVLWSFSPVIHGTVSWLFFSCCSVIIKFFFCAVVAMPRREFEFLVRDFA